MRLKKGDIVTVKTMKQLKKEFGLDYYGNIDTSVESFPIGLQYLCGNDYIVEDIKDGLVTIKDHELLYDAYKLSPDIFYHKEEYGLMNMLNLNNLKHKLFSIGDSVLLLNDKENFSISDNFGRRVITKVDKTNNKIYLPSIKTRYEEHDMDKVVKWFPDLSIRHLARLKVLKELLKDYAQSEYKFIYMDEGIKLMTNAGKKKDISVFELLFIDVLKWVQSPISIKQVIKNIDKLMDIEKEVDSKEKEIDSNE